MAVGRDGLHVFDDLLLIPDVVASGEHLSAEIEEFVRRGRGDAEATGGVFRIDYYKVDMVLVDNRGEMFADDTPAGTAKYIPHKKNLQSITPLLDLVTN